MEELHISWAAIGVTVVANFFIGFLWYSVLFKNAWAKELGFDTGTKPPANAMIRGLIFSVIGNFLLAYVFAHNNAAWSFVPGAGEMSATENILSASIFTWLGFYVPGDLSRVAWEGASWKLFGINTAYHFTILLVAAVILTLM